MSAQDTTPGHAVGDFQNNGITLDQEL